MRATLKKGMKAFDAQLASGTATFTAEVPEGWPAEQDLP
jgi:hypothetical protein